MSFADMWNKSEGVSNSDVLDGDYVAEVLVCKTGEAKKSGLPMIEWQLKILTGPQSGRIWIYRTMDENKPFTIDKAKQDFIVLGLTPTASEMNATMNSLAGKVVKVKVETKDGYNNKYIMGFTEKPAAAEMPVDDGAPF